jgi:hypothetical protein
LHAANNAELDVGALMDFQREVGAGDLSKHSAITADDRDRTRLGWGP